MSALAFFKALWFPLSVMRIPNIFGFNTLFPRKKCKKRATLVGFYRLNFQKHYKYFRTTLIGRSRI
jgi:hypothetical protein